MRIPEWLEQAQKLQICGTEHVTVKTSSVMAMVKRCQGADIKAIKKENGKLKQMLYRLECRLGAIADRADSAYKIVRDARNGEVKK